MFQPVPTRFQRLEHETPWETRVVPTFRPVPTFSLFLYTRKGGGYLSYFILSLSKKVRTVRTVRTSLEPVGDFLFRPPAEVGTGWNKPLMTSLLNRAGHPEGG